MNLRSKFLPLGILAALAMLVLATVSTSPASAASGTSGTSGAVDVLTSPSMYAAALASISPSQRGVNIFVPSGNTPRTPANPAPTVIVVAGYSPQASAGIVRLARAISPTATIVVVSVPATASQDAKTNAIGHTLAGFGVQTSAYVTTSTTTSN